MNPSERRKLLARVATLLQVQERQKGQAALLLEDFAYNALLELQGTPSAPTRAQYARSLLNQVIDLQDTVAKEDKKPKRNPAVL